MKPEVATNSAKCNELSEKRSNAEEELSTLYENGNNLQKSSKNLINCNRKTATLQMVRTELLQLI